MNMKEEQRYLDRVLHWLNERIVSLGDDMQRHEMQEIKLKAEAWEERLDSKDNSNVADNAVVQQFLRESWQKREEMKKRLKEYRLLLPSPFFGRIDFQFDEMGGEGESERFYFGLRPIFDSQNCVDYVVDWRAPLASLYYESDLGQASYQSPGGIQSGVLFAKKQILITRGNIRLIQDSGKLLYDELLQLTLSGHASPRMKQIVATIQGKQNEVIRSPENRHILVLGVAGSGKTSIALHRAAWLLYRNPGLRSEEILLLSPNRQFSEYISEVMPALSEDQTLCQNLDEIEVECLSGFDARYLLSQIPDADGARLGEAADWDLPEFIRNFCLRFERRNFVASDIALADIDIPAREILGLYLKSAGKTPPFLRIKEMAELLAERYAPREEKQREQDILTELEAMMEERGLEGIYQSLRRDDAFRRRYPLLAAKESGAALDRVDFALLCLLKLLLFGGLIAPEIRFLLVDEAQDLLPLEHELLRRGFRAKMNLFADPGQAIRYPQEDEDLRRLQAYYGLREEDIYRLEEAYRSSWEIMNYAATILPSASPRVLERHEAAVECLRLDSAEERNRELIAAVERVKEEGRRSLAILCSGEEERRQISTLLLAGGYESSDVALLPPESSFALAVLLPEEAKGMEFDAVILADVGADKFSRPIDRKRLFVSVTRALHRLILFSVGRPSPWLPPFEPRPDETRG